jgi:hypothetical protein
MYWYVTVTTVRFAPSEGSSISIWPTVWPGVTFTNAMACSGGRARW